jgi:hypothetical protein
MFKWQEEKADRNRRLLARLTKALPHTFPSDGHPSLNSANATARDRFIATDADRQARGLAARSEAPAGWTAVPIRRFWTRFKQRLKSDEAKQLRAMRLNSEPERISA